MMQQQTQPVAPTSAHNAYSYASHNVTKTRQVVMIYDGLISMVLQARKAIEEESPEDRFNALQRACMVVLGLQAALDYERGGEISRMLDDFYFGIDSRLMRLNREPNLKALDGIVKEVRMMREAWVEVDQQSSAAGSESDQPATPSAEKISSICVSA